MVAAARVNSAKLVVCPLEAPAAAEEEEGWMRYLYT